MRVAIYAGRLSYSTPPRGGAGFAGTRPHRRASCEEGTMVITNHGADSGHEPSGELLWNIKTVIQKTGLSRATIYRYVKCNLFPPRRRIGPNRVAWLAAEVVAWAESRPPPSQ